MAQTMWPKQGCVFIQRAVGRSTGALFGAGTDYEYRWEVRRPGRVAGRMSRASRRLGDGRGWGWPGLARAAMATSTLMTEPPGSPCPPASHRWARCHPPTQPGVWRRQPDAPWLQVRSVLPSVPLASGTSRAVRGAVQEGRRGGGIRCRWGLPPANTNTASHFQPPSPACPTFPPARPLSRAPASSAWPRAAGRGQGGWPPLLGLCWQDPPEARLGAGQPVGESQAPPRVSPSSPHPAWWLWAASWPPHPGPLTLPLTPCVP